MKRTLSLILSMLMVLSLFTGLNVGAAENDLAETGAEAEFADTGMETIYNVDIINVSEPIPGESPVYSASVPSGVKYKIKDYTGTDFSYPFYNGVQWYKGGFYNHQEMRPTDKFIAGEKYTVEIMIDTISDQYCFPYYPEIRGTINGESCSVGFDTLNGEQNMGAYVLTKTFSGKKVIKSIEINDVVLPNPWQKPSENATVPDGKGYKFHFSNDPLAWYDPDGNYMNPSTTQFGNDTTYVLKVSLDVVSEEYEFAGKDILTVTINNKKVTLGDDFYRDRDGGYVIIKARYYCHNETINTVSVTDVIAPMPGAFANTCCTIPSGCGYKTRYNYYDAVTWYTEEGDVLNPNTDKFVGGKKYTAQIALLALDGYVFSESSTGTINGTNARVRVANQRKTLYVNLTFTCPKAITAADCAVTDPVAGEKPNYTAVSGDSSKYYAEIINWFKGSGDRAEQMASRESFEAGNTYSVRVRYTAQDGYVFDENTVYTVNGQSTTYLGRGIYETSFTVINPNQPKPLASVSCTVTKPIAGQKPDNIAVPADSTKYSATVGSWIYGTGRSARTMTDDEEFIEGKSYQVQVKFTANRGYYLTDDTFCIINGKAATKVTIRGEDYYVVIFTAEAATTAVTEFSVTNIIEPVAGQSPYYYAAVPAGKGYLVDEDFTDGTWVNGVLWHNDTDNKDMTENDTFEEDKQYTVTVLLDSAAGYSFAESVSGKLNGENAEVIKYSNSSIGVYRTFICRSSAMIGDTNLDGRITISDVTAIQRHIAELDIFTDEQIALADTNGDGVINITDATHLQKYLAEFDGIVLGKQPTA